MDDAECLAQLSRPLPNHQKRSLEVVPVSFEIGENCDGCHEAIKLTLTCDWGVGIGGGLWSAGMLLCNQIASRPSFFRSRLNGTRVLELGAGTGLIGLTAAHLCSPRELILTDLASHLPLLRANVDANIPGWNTVEAQSGHLLVKVEEYDWSKSSDFGPRFDIILGGDLAYNPHLYGPLIQAIKRNSDKHTLTFLGVTRTDTKPSFYRALVDEGFEYFRIPDWEVEGKSEAGALNNFGLLIIFLRRVD